MKEAYVKFGTAKLLKEKGFDWDCEHYYKPNGEIVRTFHTYGSRNINSSVLYEHQCSAPTQQMACRWLREEKGVFVDIRVYSGLPVQFGYDISVLYPDKTLVDKGGTFGFSSYEEATEKGLKYVLQNLSNIEQSRHLLELNI